MWNKNYRVKYQYQTNGGVPMTTTRTFSGRDRVDVIQQLRNYNKSNPNYSIYEVYSIEEW